MKKALFIIGLCIICVSSFSQKCNFKKNEKDPFTGQTIKISEKITFRPFSIKEPELHLTFEKIDKDYFLGINILVYGKTSTILTKDKKMSIKLNDDSNIECTVQEEKSGDYVIKGYSALTSYTVKYPISEADLQRIAKSGIKIVRINVDQPNDFIFKERNANKVLDFSKCVLQD